MMKTRKIAALLLAVFMLAGCVPVMAEETPEATVQVTSAPVLITPQPTEESAEVPTETPTEEPSEAPVMPMSEEVDEETPAPVAEQEEVETPATEAPATEVPATEVPATEAPATEAPATEAPATEAPAYEPVYAVIPGDTELFADKELTEIFGKLTGSEILRVVEEDEAMKLYAVIFDTEESIETASAETAYFRAEEEIEWLDEAETEKALETMKTFREADGECIPYIEFEYPEPDPTEEPTEAPAEEPTETPVVDENGLIVEELIPAEPVESEPAEDDSAVAEEETSEDLPSVEDVLIDETAAEDTVVETESPEAAPECSVVASMYASSENVALGDTITVKAELIGYEGLTYTCEWECAATDENGEVIGEWESTGITELEHSFVLDETNAQVAWRLRTVVEG